jgi:hypothetical protein
MGKTEVDEGGSNELKEGVVLGFSCVLHRTIHKQ